MMPTNPRDESKRLVPVTLRRTPRQRRTLVIMVGLVVIAALGAFLAVVLLSDRRQEASEPAGVQSFEDLSRNHTYEPVTYEQSPPVGGDHNPIWQNAGFYEEPMPNEKAVHTMEHGAVRITYEPDLPQDQKDELAPDRGEPGLPACEPLSGSTYSGSSFGVGQTTTASERGRPRPPAVHPGLPEGSSDP